MTNLTKIVESFTSSSCNECGHRHAPDPEHHVDVKVETEDHKIEIEVRGLCLACATKLGRRLVAERYPMVRGKPIRLTSVIEATLIRRTEKDIVIDFRMPNKTAYDVPEGC